MPNPGKGDSCADHPKNHLFTADCKPKYDRIVMPIVEETRSTQLAAPAKTDNDSEIARCCTSSLSLSSNSASFLLSQCSSLASLPSLGLTSSSDLYAEAQLLVDSGGISAHCSCTTTLKNTGDLVASVGSPNNGFLYSASSACAALSLKTWSREGGLYPISAGFGSKKEGGVRAIVVVRDQVFTSHCDLKIRVWARSRSGNRENVFCTGGSGSGRDAKHRLVAVLPTRWDCIAKAVTPGGYTQVRRHHRKLWLEHTDVISAMAVDAKQGYLYSGSWDRSVKVWRLRDLKCVESFRAHDDAINALELSPEGRFLYSGAADSKIRVWTWAVGSRSLRLGHSLVATLEAHRSAVNALALTADGGLLYSGACDKAIVVWEREESAQHACLAGALRGHRQAVLCLATCGDTLCSGSADKTIRVWQRLAGRLHVCLAVLQGHSAPVRSLTLCLREQQLPTSSASAHYLACYSAALDREIRVWQLNFPLPTS